MPKTYTMMVKKKTKKILTPKTYAMMVKKKYKEGEKKK